MNDNGIADLGRYTVSNPTGVHSTSVSFALVYGPGNASSRHVGNTVYGVCIFSVSFTRTDDSGNVNARTTNLMNGVHFNNIHYIS